jgi:hypothetical protein
VVVPLDTVIPDPPQHQGPACTVQLDETMTVPPANDAARVA